MRTFLLHLAAFLRINHHSVCDASRGKRDYHDWPDSVVGEPWHMYEHTCKRCKKKFTI
jgi:hypothetical protein